MVSGAWCELGGRQCVVNVGMGAGPMGWARLEIAFLFVENVICTPVIFARTGSGAVYALRAGPIPKHSRRGCGVRGQQVGKRVELTSHYTVGPVHSAASHVVSRAWRCNQANGARLLYPRKRW